MYIALIANPGVGKSAVISAGRAYLDQLKDFSIAPTSMTGASLVEALVSAKRPLIDMTERDPLKRASEYNSMMLLPDELGAFIQTFKDNDVVPLLTTFYDVVPYGRTRTTKSIDHKISRPQLNILAGSTPSNLLQFIPPIAWSQGFTSRFILVYSNEWTRRDDFAEQNKAREPFNAALLYDLQVIQALQGRFTWTEEWREKVEEWRDDEKAGPSHPKLEHYRTRRRAHLYKLAMVCAVDRGNDLVLTEDVFKDALYILTEVEGNMNQLFEQGSTTVDGTAMDELVDFIQRNGPVREHQLIHEACKRVPAHSVKRVLELLSLSERIVFNSETGKWSA